MTAALHPDVDTPASIRRAWQRYLAEVRGADAEAYERVEEKAWRRLVSNLAALDVLPQNVGEGKER